jgi:hypothetical protein
MSRKKVFAHCRSNSFYLKEIFRTAIRRRGKYGRIGNLSFVVYGYIGLVLKNIGTLAKCLVEGIG